MKNDNAVTGVFIFISLVTPLLFSVHAKWTWWFALLLGLALLANAAILWLRLQLLAPTHMVPAASPSDEGAKDHALAQTRDLLKYVFPSSGRLRAMFAEDLARAAEQCGKGEYGRSLRRAFGLDSTPASGARVSGSSSATS